jgi:hypothetical protein
MVDRHCQGMPGRVGELIGARFGVVASKGAAWLDSPYVGWIIGQFLPRLRALQQLHQLA